MPNGKPRTPPEHWNTREEWLERMANPHFIRFIEELLDGDPLTPDARENPPWAALRWLYVRWCCLPGKPSQRHPSQLAELEAELRGVTLEEMEEELERELTDKSA